ncbi:MAG TPA: integrase arm-type DNA-binding domain-containing protein [Xanthobacteraceae bacterium]|nr:integrase arm-type DNA-binding domain-containing protein [Xanthobacteraceae bacterium]
MAGQRITKRVVDGLKVGPHEYAVWDAQLTGFGVRVRPSGAMSYVVGYRAGSGRAAPKKRLTIGAVGKITPEQARTLAQGILGAVAHGRDPAKERRKAEASAENTLRSIAENYFAREGHKLRSVHVRQLTLERLIYPTLGARQIDDIKRSDINKLLDKIEDKNGARTATLALAYLRRMMNWHATRSDEFRTPIVRGMARGATTKRDRVLTEDELRAFWRAAEAWEHPFTRLLRFILLTATRREEAAGMQWSELEEAIWTIPAARYKTKIDFELPLSGAALNVLGTITRFSENGFVFTTSGKTRMGGFSKFKARFDGLMFNELRKITEERGDDPADVILDRWTVHDLRRTARSAMTRAGVPPDHAERALGHVIGGVRGVYDRHGYRDEKRRAFETLAAHVERVVNPQLNLVPIRRGTGPMAEASL